MQGSILRMASSDVWNQRSIPRIEADAEGLMISARVTKFY